MPRIPGIRRYIRLAGTHSRASDVRTELAFHIEEGTDELVATGMSREAARAQALRSFGDVERFAGDCERIDSAGERDMRRSEWLASVGQDLRYAARGFARSRVFTGVITLTLALGIGANTAIFSAIDAVILRPLPYTAPERLVAVTMIPGASISKATLELMRQRQTAFDGIAGYSGWGFALTGRDTPELLNGAAATANLFSVLGARAAFGRVFHPDEDQPGRGNVVVLSHGLWMRLFNGDRAALGQSITLNGERSTIIGVMPPEFVFPRRGSELWVPTVIDRADTRDYAAGYLLAVARLRGGATLATSQADIAAVARTLRETRSEVYDESYGRAATVQPLRDALVGKTRSLLLLLFGAVAFVLLIACVNVANLLLARSAVRSREMAVRASLGAGRGRLTRQLLTESIFLSALGGLAGIALAHLFASLLGGALPAELPRTDLRVLDGRVLLFTAFLSILVGILFGAAPAHNIARGDLNATLRAGGRGSTLGGGERRSMQLLVASELALALVLAAGAGLVLRSFQRLNAEDPGFHADGVLTLTADAPATRYPTPEHRTAFLDQALARLRALPGVTNVGAIHLLPFGGSNWNPSLIIEGRPVARGESMPEVDWRVATADYFPTLGIPLVRGRLFSHGDRLDGPQVGLINQALASRDFPGEDPIGKRVYTFFEGTNNWVEIVGVVGDTKDQTLASRARPQLYRPFSQRPMLGMAIMVRTAGAPLGITNAAREAIWSVDRDVPIDGVRALADVVADSVAQPRLLVMLLGSFAVLALLLGAVGIYGVMSFAVSQRAQELAVRVALGAKHTDIVRLIVMDALRVAAVGLIVGLAATLALTRVLAAQLYETKPTDPETLASVTLLLASVAILASYLPARRASRADPVRALGSS